jgi:DNA-binding GntR family transcriptional regulator
MRVAARTTSSYLPTGTRSVGTESDRAYQELRDAILRGRLAPGAALVEAELMASVGVGRTPLREAVRLLVTDGLVEVVTRRGTYVTRVDLNACAALLDVRLTVERLVARSVVAHASAAQVAELGRFVDEGAAALDGSGDDLGFDAGFHDRLLAMAANPYLGPMYWRLVGESMRLLNAVGAPLEPVAELVPEFRRAQRAMVARDADALEAALVDHVGSFQRRFDAALSGLSAAMR